jgi:hypothetical protein
MQQEKESKRSVEVFITNIDRPEDARKVIDLLTKAFVESTVSVDLDDCDHVLRIEAHNVSTAQAMQWSVVLDFLAKFYNKKRLLWNSEK